MTEPVLKAPFPWFGGKSRAAEMIWRRLGETPNYIEPFFGSGAVLLRRPWAPARYETVNDLDCYVANFWRAVHGDPEAVAYHADWPVNEACLTARHRWLMAKWRKHKFRTRMLCDPEYYDPLVAGWWVWGISCWIGAGWCDERSEWGGPGAEGNRGRAMHQEPKRPSVDRPKGVSQSRSPSPTPEMMAQSERGVAGARGVPVQRPDLAHSARGATGVRPDLASDGKGVHAPWRKRPHLHNDQGSTLATNVPEGRPHLQRPYELHKPPGKQVPRIGGPGGKTGVHRDAVGFDLGPGNTALLDWMQRLADRLRYVRVCCGDWSRITGKAVLTAAKPCAVFLDPPYSAAADRHDGIYACEDTEVAHAVRQWCVEHGADKSLRIALCGYEGEGHEVLVDDHGWSVESWKASGGYGRIHGEKQGRSLKNRLRERVYFSPGCLARDDMPLFRKPANGEQDA